MPDQPEPIAAPSEGLAFPSVARLELDELLDQLIARATEVKLTQGRLRHLLDATHHITAGHDLDDLVRRIVESARTLVGARHAALAVVQDGRLLRFVQEGTGPGDVTVDGGLPYGDGVLDVPLRAGGVVQGNLVVAESEHDGGFAADDEQLLTALAGAAGIAVENALLLDTARRRERWQAASARLSSDLLSGEIAPEAEVQHLLDTAVDVARAYGAAVTRVTDADPGTAHVVAAAGRLHDWAGRTAASPGSITQAALDADGPVLIADALDDPRTTGVVHRAPEVRSVLAVPLATGTSGPPGRSVLILARTVGDEAFGAVEAEMLLGFAAHATTAIELAQGRRDREAVHVLEEREQLVLSLSEQVVRRVQRVGLALTSSASGVDAGLRDHLLAQVSELDDVVRAVRDTVLPG
ncbi:GAF domain-containing protein [Actinomycetospora succinea]|uniref:GAF domain-containing protein n=1 Tax=Actinomycetospora succinea TaxID=663603 RepID=A0A4R6UU98_9PSEU|nr:GAF domain-containing protein [Actinomycetospora succinea]TDQ47044.1 GAF domain-containing protein [Actinomycetospora succinea]